MTLFDRAPLVMTIALGLAACDGAERRDADTVVRAVARFRAADNPSTPAMVEALRKTPCTAPDVCRARDTCLASGEATANALKLKDEVERGLAALERGALAKDAPDAQTLPAKLERAEALLVSGRDALPACDEQIQALKRKHRL